MKRLTTDNPKTNIEAALNLFYVKDHETFVRGWSNVPGNPDISLFDLIREIKASHPMDVDTSTNDAISEEMYDLLLDGTDTFEGIVALLYTAGGVTMSGEYNLYCAFDLEKHKQTYTNYLEVVIDEEGTIMYAVPSHQEKLLAIAAAKHGVSRYTTRDLCPPEFFCDYMTWLCVMSRAVAVWNGYCVAVNPTIKQIGALRRLKMAGVYTGPIPREEG